MTFQKGQDFVSLTTIAVLALAACSNGNSQLSPQASQANFSVSSKFDVNFDFCFKFK